MNKMGASQEEIDMKLRQMGGDVISLHGIISFIRFNFNGTELLYVYNVNAKSQYFLQMMKPFPAGTGIFSKPSELVQYIKNDIRQFKNATNSDVFAEFVSVNQNLCLSILDIKDVFMTHNVPKQKMVELKKKVREVSAMLDDIQKTSPLL